MGSEGNRETKAFRVVRHSLHPAPPAPGLGTHREPAPRVEGSDRAGDGLRKGSELVVGRDAKGLQERGRGVKGRKGMGGRPRARQEEETPQGMRRDARCGPCPYTPARYTAALQAGKEGDAHLEGPGGRVDLPPPCTLPLALTLPRPPPGPGHVPFPWGKAHRPEEVKGGEERGPRAGSHDAGCDGPGGALLAEIPQQAAEGLGRRERKKGEAAVVGAPRQKAHSDPTRFTPATAGCQARTGSGHPFTMAAAGVGPVGSRRISRGPSLWKENPRSGESTWIAEGREGTEEDESNKREWRRQGVDEEEEGPIWGKVKRERPCHSCPSQTGSAQREGREPRGPWHVPASTRTPGQGGWSRHQGLLLTLMQKKKKKQKQKKERMR